MKFSHKTESFSLKAPEETTINIYTNMLIFQNKIKIVCPLSCLVDLCVICKVVCFCCFVRLSSLTFGVFYVYFFSYVTWSSLSVRVKYFSSDLIEYKNELKEDLILDFDLLGCPEHNSAGCCYRGYEQVSWNQLLPIWTALLKQLFCSKTD